MCSRDCVEMARKVLTFIAWAIMAIIGGWTVYLTWTDDYGGKLFHDWTSRIVAIYMTLLGVLGFIQEIGVGPVRRYVGFLKTVGGKSFMFFFFGTLGLSFAVDFDRDFETNLTFCAGIYFIFMSIFGLIVLCVRRDARKVPDESKYLAPEAHADKI